MSEAKQLTLGQQIWRMAEQMALPLTRPGLVNRHPTLVALDAAPRLERRYETLAAPGLLSAQIAQRYETQDAPAPGADMPLSTPKAPVSQPAAARWSAQRWPESPSAAAPATPAVRRSAVAPERPAAQLTPPPAASTLVARSADPADQAEPADLGVASAADLVQPSEPHRSPLAAPAPATVERSRDEGGVSRTADPLPPPVVAATPITGAPPELPAARDSAIERIAVARQPDAAALPTASFAPPAAREGQAIARAADEEEPPSSRQADRVPESSGGGVAAVDLTLVQPAALRQTALMRSLPPDPLARMGLAAPDPKLGARGAEALPAPDPAPVALPVARTPMRAADQQPIMAPTALAPRPPMPPATPTAEAPRALPAPGTVRRVPARRTSIAERAAAPADGDAPANAGASLQAGGVAQEVGDEAEDLPFATSGVGALEQTGAVGDTASRAADPGDPVGAASEAAPPLQRSAEAPPGSIAQGPEPAALGDPPAAVGGPGRGAGLPPIARQYADLPLAARLSDPAAPDETPEGGSMESAASPALAAGPPMMPPVAQRAPEIVASAAQPPMGAAPGGALAALPLQRAATPILRHAATPLAGRQPGAAPTLHDPSWRPATVPALGMAARTADAPTDRALPARAAHPAPLTLAGSPVAETPQLPLTAGWRSADPPDVEGQSIGRAERSAAIDQGGGVDVVFPDAGSLPGQTLAGAPLPLVPTISAQIRRMQAESPALSRAFGIPGSGMLDKLGDVRDRVSDATSDLPGQLPDPSAPLELVRGPAAEASRLMNAARDAVGGAESRAQSAGQALVGGAAAPGGAAGAGQPNIEQIARQVYDHLRRQLLIDRERYGRR